MNFWRLRVVLSRWRNRFRYLLAAPSAYRNWWAMPLPKLGVSVVLELRNGCRYFVRSGTMDLAVVNEAAILNPYLGPGYLTLPEDGVVVDVGANIGDFTIQLAKICSRGRVIAVEPIGEYVLMIQIHKLLNSVDNVTCVQAALGDHEGQTEIHLDGSKSSACWGGDKTERVPLTTLSRLMGELGIDRVDLLKLDCEGAEWDILPAAEEVLPRIRQICMEFHCAEGWTPDKLASWLRERGYQVEHTSGPWNGMLWAWRQTKG